MDKSFILGLIIGIIFNLLICIWNWRYLDSIKNTGKKIKMNNRFPKMESYKSNTFPDITVLLIFHSLTGDFFCF